MMWTKCSVSSASMVGETGPLGRLRSGCVVAARSDTPGTIPTPGPDGSRIQAVRLALNANAIEDFSLHRDEIEAIISEARAEAISDATKLVEAADGLPEKERSG